MKIGATYSHIEIERLNLPPQDSFKQTLDLKFDLLRLGIYWDESEPKQGIYDFLAIEKLLKQCDKAGQEVVLSVGAKAPRWPEFYVPRWLQAERVEDIAKPLLEFIEAAVSQLKHHSCIAAWQVENEPLDHSGPHKWQIPPSLLAQEVQLVRQLDDRPIHINMWGDNITRSKEYAQAARLADSVGLDIYYHQPTSRDYHGPRFRMWQYSWWRRWQQLRGQLKPLWITELQAEGWEKEDSHKFSDNPGSISPQSLVSNFKSAQELGPEVILFWGLEYWLWQAKQGRPQLLEAARQVVHNHRN